MTGEALSRIYNLGRLGHTGDEVVLDADEAERAALAKAAEILSVPKFSARIVLQKLSPTRFSLHYDVAAEILQACVVTLEPLTAHVSRDFVRELNHAPNLHRVVEKEVVLAAEDDDIPDDIESLHYDLAGPLLEEFLLAIDPYPRAPGVEFAPPEGMGDKPESPFAALKALKPRD